MLFLLKKKKAIYYGVVKLFFTLPLVMMVNKILFFVWIIPVNFENYYFSEQHSRPFSKSLSAYIKVAFSDGGLSNFRNCIKKMLVERCWEKLTENHSGSKYNVRNAPYFKLLLLYYGYLQVWFYGVSTIFIRFFCLWVSH